MVSRNKRGGRKTRVQNVRVMDEYSGSDGAYVDRCLAQLHNTESQVTMMCSSQTVLTPSTTAGTFLTTNVTGATVRGTDDFVNIATQFLEYRVRCIRVDVYDINPGQTSVNLWSNIHDDQVSIPTATIDTIADRPDAQSVPTGTGKIQLSWRMHGQPESEFQSVEASLSPVDFGGIQGTFGANALGQPKFQYVMKAIVDFRGRR